MKNNIITMLIALLSTVYAVSQTPKYIDADPKDFLPEELELHFNEALIYEFRELRNDTIYREDTFRIYFNKKNQYFLLIPKDEMCNGVLSLPNGKYYTFFTDAHGEKKAFEYYNEEVNGFNHKVSPKYVSTKKTNITSKFNKKYSPYKGAISKHILFDFLELKKERSIFYSTEFPIKNAYQIYGFSETSIPLEYGLPPHYFQMSNSVDRNMLVTEFEENSYDKNSESRGAYFKLINFGHTTYYFDTKDYKFFKAATRYTKEKVIKNPFKSKN